MEFEPAPAYAPSPPLLFLGLERVSFIILLLSHIEFSADCIPQKDQRYASVQSLNPKPNSGSKFECFNYCLIPKYRFFLFLSLIKGTVPEYGRLENIA